jgi:hypothetical protein
MTIDYSEDGKVKIIMSDYIDRMLDEAPDDMSGTAVTPAANHLFDINDKVEKLDDKQSELYHRLTAKALYLCQRSTRPANCSLFPVHASQTTRH